MIYHILLLQNSLISKNTQKNFSPAALLGVLPHTPPAAFGKYAPPPYFLLATHMAGPLLLLFKNPDFQLKV